ncbi:MAG: permease-like cell division protein FtsX [Lachnospiraceae bacterium]|nr:permease-like cell division protein FtsX [Lachnospiraceae bacterium]MBQ5852074.1 permease-like cell division protein FtsX [Lachnospiraceae bacterium]MEE0920041.1 permease-like cell division protein FtsX [Lachnospiraceae bacterium]
MKISTLFYCLKQGFRNIIKNKWFTLASVATISACLFLFGLFYSILTNFEHMVKTAEEGVSVTALLDGDLSEERTQEIARMIALRDEVRESVYVSADETWEKFKAENLEGLADGITENPLADCAHFEIYMKDVSMQSDLVDYLGTVEGIRKINQSAITAQTLTGVNAIISYVSIGIIVILFLVSLFLISNTVTIGISVRKEEIQIMKYIGATDFFVRSPFVIEGIILGIIGSFIPLVAIYVIYNEAMIYIAKSFPFLSQLVNFIPVNEVFTSLVPICIGIGVGIGFIGSYTTVRKHLSV